MEPLHLIKIQIGWDNSKATICSIIKQNNREAAEANPIWLYYGKKESKVKINVVRIQRNKRHKMEPRRQ